jgi:hypothetical protein
MEYGWCCASNPIQRSTHAHPYVLVPVTVQVFFLKLLTMATADLFCSDREFARMGV